MHHPVSVYFCPAPLDAEAVERGSVARGEALELVERFWAEIEAARAGGMPEDGEINLCFSRDPASDFIEFAVFDPAEVTGRHAHSERWKLLGFIPMTSSANLLLDCGSREDVAALVEAFLATPGEGRFAAKMLEMGARKVFNRAS
jgi:hypothetical protein